MDQASSLRNIVKAATLEPVVKKEQIRSRVITVTSGKGGVGKSNTCINLAVWFKRLGYRVIILDADFGLANIEIMFGTIPKHTLSDLIHKGMDIKDIITWGPGDIGFISGGSGIANMANLSRDDLIRIIGSLSKLDEMADIILIDTGAGIADTVLEFLVASGEILLVTTPEPTSITDSYSLIKALYAHHGFDKEDSHIKVVANKVRNENEGRNLFAKLQVVVANYLNIQLEHLGTIPYDDQLIAAVMQQKPVSLNNMRARSDVAYEDMANRLISNGAVSSVNRGMAAFFSHIMNSLNKQS